MEWKTQLVTIIQPSCNENINCPKSLVRIQYDEHLQINANMFGCIYIWKNLSFQSFDFRWLRSIQVIASLQTNSGWKESSQLTFKGKYICTSCEKE